jgi:hypothetical protein
MAKWWKIIFWVVIALIVALTIFLAFNSHTAK